MTRSSPRSLVRQRGNALLMVMILGTTASLAAGALMQHEAVVEKRAVSESLARTRAYWAAMGHINYALSRTRNYMLCGSGSCDRDSARATSVQGYLNEVCGALTSSQPNTCTTTTWTYRDGDGSSYFLQVQAAASPESAAFDIRSGHIKIVASFPTTGQSALPVLNGLSNRLRSVEIRFCAAKKDGSWTYCNNPSTATSAEQDTDHFLIKAVDRPPLF